MAPTVDATVTSKGQVTIPKEIRERLGLEAGQTVEFELQNGEMTVRPKRPPMERLSAVSAEIQARHDAIDVDAIRREAKRAWKAGPDLPDREG